MRGAWNAMIGALAIAGACSDWARAQVPVPPFEEIEVLDPRADPEGKPAASLVSTYGGGSVVDIPRTVLVHKHYYSGDRDFQSRSLPGGPSIVVVDHPRTGERLYLDVTLPPGAPRVYYHRHYIRYEYGEQAVCISFWPTCEPKVTYRQGRTVADRAGSVTRRVGGAATRLARQSQLPAYGREAGEIVVGTASAAVGAVGTVADATVGQALAAIRSTPLGASSQGALGQAATRREAAAIRRTETLKERASADRPTIR